MEYKASLRIKDWPDRYENRTILIKIEKVNPDSISFLKEICRKAVIATNSPTMNDIYMSIADSQTKYVIDKMIKYYTVNIEYGNC